MDDFAIVMAQLGNGIILLMGNLPINLYSIYAPPQSTQKEQSIGQKADAEH